MPDQPELVPPAVAPRRVVLRLLAGVTGLLAGAAAALGLLGPELANVLQVAARALSGL